MNGPEANHDVEAMLGRMRLRQPSQRVDQVIGQMADEARLGSARLESANDATQIPVSRFGWAALVSTALVAALCGLIIGSAFSVGGTKNTTEPSAGLVAALPKVSEMTPVKFSLQAYEVLHGHSTNSDFANCSLCHVEGQDEAFEGWFYGDDDFFKSHNFQGQQHQGHAKCSSCHLNAKDAQHDHGLQKIRGIEHADFPNVKCSACHKVAEAAQEKGEQAALKKKIAQEAKSAQRAFKDNGDFQHHF